MYKINNTRTVGNRSKFGSRPFGGGERSFLFPPHVLSEKASCLGLLGSIIWETISFKHAPSLKYFRGTVSIWRKGLCRYAIEV